jgi:hypothetical protein
VVFLVDIEPEEGSRHVEVWPPGTLEIGTEVIATDKSYGHLDGYIGQVGRIIERSRGFDEVYYIVLFSDGAEKTCYRRRFKVI